VTKSVSERCEATAGSTVDSAVLFGNECAQDDWGGTVEHSNAESRGGDELGRAQGPGDGIRDRAQGSRRAVDWERRRGTSR
jgi:hypothetical protein